jgi:hypothetical protein
MKQSVWIFSILLASVFLLGYWVPDLSRGNSTDGNSTGAVLASSSYREPLTPTDRKAMESVALEFTNHYYTYTQENYIEEGLKLLPLLTLNFKQPYESLVENGLVAAKAVQAESAVISTQILDVEKITPEQGLIYLQFKAKVSNNGKETLNRYSTTLSLAKENNQWRINGILSEDPVEFINIRNLL